MSALVRREGGGALAEMGRAQAMVRGARDELSRALASPDLPRALKIKATDRAKAVGEAMVRLSKALEHGTALALDAADLIYDASKGRAVLDKEERAERPKGAPKNGYTRVTIPGAQKTAESRRAPLARVSPEVERGVREALRKHEVPISANAVAAFAKLDPAAASMAIAKLGDAPDIRAAIREAKRDAVRAQLEDIGAREAKAVEGVFDVVVIDPPWPMEKVERDERPSQVGLDYPTMAAEELRGLHVPCADACHVWLWTTQRFLPLALSLLDSWGLKYVCTFVWHKPGGPQPFGLPQYNCEFALYARRGSPIFLDTRALPTCFDAQRGAHSEKPAAFYETVRRVTAGRRLDMFNRRVIEGFDGWGKESADATE